MIKTLIAGFLTPVVLCLLFLFALTGCVSTPDVHQNSEVVVNARSARMLIVAYVDNDPITTSRLEGPLAALSYLKAEAEQIDQGAILVDFFENPANRWYINQAVANYLELKNAVIEYNARTGKPIPAVIRDYDSEVLRTYHEIMGAIKSRDRTEKFSKVVTLMVKMMVANNGMPI